MSSSKPENLPRFPGRARPGCSGAIALLYFEAGHVVQLQFFMKMFSAAKGTRTPMRWIEDEQ
jgi:hypothetical protein